MWSCIQHFRHTHKDNLTIRRNQVHQLLQEHKQTTGKLVLDELI